MWNKDNNFDAFIRSYLQAYHNLQTYRHFTSKIKCSIRFLFESQKVDKDLERDVRAASACLTASLSAVWRKLLSVYTPSPPLSLLRLYVSLI